MSTTLVVANRTLATAAVLEAIRSRAAADADRRFVVVVPQTLPRHGNVIYDEAVRAAAQVRVDLAIEFLSRQGLTIFGEVGDSDPFLAVTDAVHEHGPDEIVLSTLPAASSGWLRRDLPGRIADETGLPVEHLVHDPAKDPRSVTTTLLVANRTAAQDELARHLAERAEDSEKPRVHIVVIPLESGDGAAHGRARSRLAGVVSKLRASGLVTAGLIGDPDPYTATMNALDDFTVDDIIISTLPETKSGWLRADLIERVRRSAAQPVEHLIASESTTASA